MGPVAAIQRSWLPSDGILTTPRVTVACSCSTVNPCGGDLVAVYSLGEAALVVVGDATGHGFDAALLCGVVKGACDLAVRSIRPLSPPRLLAILNDAVVEASNGLVAMSCSVAMVASRTLTVASAGHPLPYIVRAEGGLESVLAYGSVLGTTTSPSYEPTTVALRSGDRVLWYTDGVVDCENESRKRFGHRRLRSLLERGSNLGARSLVRELGAELFWFRGDAPLRDDMSFVAASIK